MGCLSSRSRQLESDEPQLQAEERAYTKGTAGKALASGLGEHPLNLSKDEAATCPKKLGLIGTSGEAPTSEVFIGASQAAGVATEEAASTEQVHLEEAKLAFENYNTTHVLSGNGQQEEEVGAALALEQTVGYDDLSSSDHAVSLGESTDSTSALPSLRALGKTASAGSKSRRRRFSSLSDVYEMSFPMYVFEVSTLLKLETMLSFEQMMEAELLMEATAEMDQIFFVSHQWTSFTHPDPTATQLQTLQDVFVAMREKRLPSLFGSRAEFAAFAASELGTSLPFPPVTEEELQDEAMHGHVWLDFACVPQVVWCNS